MLEEKDDLPVLFSISELFKESVQEIKDTKKNYL